ncbi:MAG: quinone oxidoreductase family protein [Pseudonocardia sp.]
MRAVVFDRPGEPSVLRVDDVADPAAPTGDRILVRVAASSVNGADLVALRQGRAALVPPEITAVEAAALPLAGLTALQALFGRAGLGVRQAPRVLVHGAAGGIGSFALQLAVLAGVRVTGTARAAKHELVRGMGAHEIVDSRSELPDGRWDVVLDSPGSLDAATVRRVLAPDRIADAHRYAESGEVRGKVVITVGAGGRE